MNERLQWFIDKGISNPEDETWREVLHSEGHYSVSSFGRVRSNSRTVVCRDGRELPISERMLKPGHNQHGYEVVAIAIRKKGTFRVHRLVAEAFIPNPNNLPVVNHLNGIKTDNRVENLEWCTQPDNIRHSFATGLSKPAYRAKGKKLSESEVDEIRVLLSKGEAVKGIACHYRVTPATIYAINSSSIHKQRGNGQLQTKLYRAAPRPIKSISPDGTVTEYESIAEAIRRVGAERGCIWRVLKGKMKTHLGMRWVYFDTKEEAEQYLAVNVNEKKEG